MTLIRHQHLKTMNSLAKLAVFSMFSLLICSCVAARAGVQTAKQKQVADPSSGSLVRSATDAGTAQARNIDWDTAASDARTAGEVHQVVVLNPRQTDNANQPIQVAVPILLPATNRPIPLLSGRSIEFDKPRLLLTNNGFTSVQKSPAIDLIIDASNRSLFTEAAAQPMIAIDFDGDYQQTEGGGGEVSISRYGALYSIQLVCNNPTQTDCVSEAMLRSVIDQLVVTQPIRRGQ